MQYERSPFGQLEQRRAQVNAQKENSARLAKTYAWWTTHGRGEIQVDKVFAFGLTFVEEPVFSYGAALDDDGIDLIDGHFPRCHGAVWQWRRDTNGYYTGAWVFFIVDTSPPGSYAVAGEPLYTIHHHMGWEGIALKSVPAYLLDQ